MKRIRKILIVTFILFCSFDGYSNENEDDGQKKNPVNKSVSIFPHYFKVQYAGNIGYGSFGIGYNWLSNKLQSEIFYGYVPSWAGGHTIRTVALKNMVNLFTLHPKENICIKQQVGFSTNLAFTKRTYFKLPDYYPDNYYSPNAIHVMPFFSQECTMSFPKQCFVKRTGFYLEYGAMDTYLYQSLKNKELNFFDAWSLALGVVISF